MNGQQIQASNEETDWKAQFDSYKNRKSTISLPPPPLGTSQRANYKTITPDEFLAEMENLGAQTDNPHNGSLSASPPKAAQPEVEERPNDFSIDDPDDGYHSDSEQDLEDLPSPYPSHNNDGGYGSDDDTSSTLRLKKHRHQRLILTKVLPRKLQSLNLSQAIVEAKLLPWMNLQIC
ncbi:hypothetical protein [Endozoicomonas ascidiicola]|uniref:hypothetical protein n=1 Tax=Endozoicomonas ascidiicola TaxID=1698521 RepID=UPI00082DABDE|nr:hypothetical protein [Endozoicomonas ascidiicola]